MTKNIIVLHPDLHVLAGDVRAMLMFADLFKFMGFNVRFLYTDIRPQHAWYFTLSEIKKYHPIKYISPRGDPNKEGITGDFQIVAHRYLTHRLYDYFAKLEIYDTLFTDQVVASFLGEDLPITSILYVHYPDRPTGPKYPVKLWSNSSYIRELVVMWWHRSTEVVPPPLHVEIYNSKPSFKERYYDAVMFGQFYVVKGFRIAKLLADKGYKVAVIGARVSSYNPPGEGSIDVYSNVPVSKYVEVLSNSKIYIHGRPGEHFGITITEAMASGCPVIVHKSGGQWTDIVEYGKYGLGFQNEEELIRNFKFLLEEDNWNRYHDLAVKKAKTYSFENISKKVSKLLRTGR